MTDQDNHHRPRDHRRRTRVQAADGEAADGEAADGEAADGEAADGEAADGYAPSRRLIETMRPREMADQSAENPGDVFHDFLQTGRAMRRIGG